MIAHALIAKQFLSTPSARRATLFYQERTCKPIFLSTPSARRATLQDHHHAALVAISIHALCEEGDPALRRSVNLSANFYPRPLRGGRPRLWVTGTRRWRFLSTPSARRATPWHPGVSAPVHYFYPRPLRGGRLTSCLRRIIIASISIHALCEEGDLHTGHHAGCAIDISIHALCEEGDACSAVMPYTIINFYPRPLRGGRLHRVILLSAAGHFYPRPLRGGRPER